MTPTQVKHGRMVSEAAIAIAEEKGGVDRAVFSIGEVSRKADLSRPCVKKYLDMMVDFGSMYATRINGHAIIYEWSGK